MLENVEESKKLITEVGLKYKIASKYTSFVGVDEKQGNTGNFMITRHVKNQLPQNIVSGIGFGGFGSAPGSAFGTGGNMSSGTLFGGTQPPPQQQAFSFGGSPAVQLFRGPPPPPPALLGSSFGASSAVPLFGGPPPPPPTAKGFSFGNPGSSLNASTPATAFSSIGSSFYNQTDSLSLGSLNMTQEGTHSQSGKDRLILIYSLNKMNTHF